MKTTLLILLCFLCGWAWPVGAETVIKRNGASPKDLSTQNEVLGQSEVEVLHEGMPSPWLKRGEICDHDFKKSEFYLQSDGKPVGEGPAAKWVMQVAHLEICSKCGILRVKPKEK